MSKNLILTIALLAGSIPAGATVLLNIDGQDYPGEFGLQYDVASMVFQVDFTGSHTCTGSTVVAPGSGLTLDVDGQLYALSGSITLEQGQDPARLVMTTTATDFTCEPDRVFRDFFFQI